MMGPLTYGGRRLTRSCNGPHPSSARIAADEPQGRYPDQ